MACTAFHTCFHCRHSWQDSDPSWFPECPQCEKRNSEHPAIKRPMQDFGEAVLAEYHEMDWGK